MPSAAEIAEGIHECRGRGGNPRGRIVIRKHALNGIILAIDLGKFNSVLCWYEPDARTERFRTTPTSPDDLTRELTRPPVARVATITYAPGRILDGLKTLS